MQVSISAAGLKITGQPHTLPSALPSIANTATGTATCPARIQACRLCRHLASICIERKADGIRRNEPKPQFPIRGFNDWETTTRSISKWRQITTRNSRCRCCDTVAKQKSYYSWKSEIAKCISVVNMYLRSRLWEKMADAKKFDRVVSAEFRQKKMTNKSKILPHSTVGSSVLF